MKVTQPMLLTVLVGMTGSARVPKDSPVRKVLKLKRFAVEWLQTVFGADSKIAKNWEIKFKKNTDRFEDRFKLCPKTEEEFVAEVLSDLASEEVGNLRRRRRNSEISGGNRKKGGKGNRNNRLPKAARIPYQFRKFDRVNPVQGIRDITDGFELWARRYVSGCRGQPETQAKRAEKWYNILLQRYEGHMAKQQSILNDQQ